MESLEEYISAGERVLDVGAGPGGYSGYLAFKGYQAGLDMLRVTGESYPGMKKSLKTLKITNEEFEFGRGFSSDCESDLKMFSESENTKIGETYFMEYNTRKCTWVVVAEIQI